MANLRQALDWAARGVPVFPLPYGEKRPVDSFPEQATLDPEKIKLLWRDPITGSKEHNIGVLCGNGVVLFDVDTKFDQQFNRSAVNNYLEAGGHFNTLVVKTASGGYQAYFRLPPGQEYANATNIIPGVDDRCQNGYGIAPGSFSIKSGGDYELYVDQPIADVPDTLLKLLKPVKSKKDRLNGHSDAEKAIPLFVEYLQRVEPAIEGQGGDQHTYNVACMGVVDYGLSVPTVTNLMIEHFNPRCMPPWEFEELVQKVENADAYAIGTFGSKDPEVILNGVEYHAPPTRPANADANPHIEYNDSLLPQNAIPVSRWLMHPMLAQGVVTTAVGPGGTGKSAWLIALACNAAVGHPFGPFTFKEPVETFLYSLEDSRAYVSGRASVICRKYGLDYDDVKTHFRIHDQTNEAIVLVEKTDKGKFKTPDSTIRILSDHKNKYPNCKVMIFDPYRKMNRGVEENSNDQQTDAMNLINHLAMLLDVSIVLPHHTPKNYMQRKDLDPSNPDAASGAGAIVTSSRIVVNILPQTPNEAERQGRRDDLFTVGVVKNNHGPLGKQSYWSREILVAPNGEQYPAPYPCDIRDAMAKVHRDYVDTLGDFMLEHNLNILGVIQAAAVVQEVYAQGRSTKSTAETLRTLFQRGAIVHHYQSPQGTGFTMALETEKSPHGFTLTPMPGQPPRAKNMFGDDDAGV